LQKRSIKKRKNLRNCIDLRHKRRMKKKKMLKLTNKSLSANITRSSSNTMRNTGLKIQPSMIIKKIMKNRKVRT